MKVKSSKSCFILPDLDSNTESDSEGIPHGSHCTMSNVHCTDSHSDRYPSLKWVQLGMESESESGNVNQPLAWL